MKVSLITAYSDIQSIGVRILSSCLKRSGHQCRSIFLCELDFNKKEKLNSLDHELPESVLRELIRLCGDTGLIGFSLMSDEFVRVKSIAQKLKSALSIPTIFGGVHPTIRPEECLQYADMVCVGEGEYAFPELLTALENGCKDISIPGIWFKKNDEVISNPVRPLIEDLDHSPFPDYDCIDSYILDEGSIKPLSPALLEKHIQRQAYYLNSGGTYGIMTSRGCPYNCSFCGNSSFRKLYKGKYSVRRRSMENVIEELVKAKENLPYINGIRFHDDTFIAASVEELKKFSELYHAEVGLPFGCYTSPLEISEEKLRILCDAGLIQVSMGIQTGSPRIQKLYRRPFSNQLIILMKMKKMH
jgi:radical SAM superfamily enzyme YgiQ (UPF0313 family)